MQRQTLPAAAEFNEATEGRHLKYLRDLLTPEEFLGFLKGSLVRSAQDGEMQRQGSAIRRAAFFSRELQYLAGPAERRFLKELPHLIPAALHNVPGTCSYAEASVLSGLTRARIKNLVYEGRLHGGSGQVQLASLAEHSATSMRSGFAKTMAGGEDLITYQQAADLLGKNYAYVADSVRRGRLHGGGGLVFKKSVDNMRKDPRWIGNRNKMAA